jgi:hypothetical protein
MEAHAPAKTVTPEQMIDQLQRRSPTDAQEAIDALLGLVELDEAVRDDIAILSARVVPEAGTVAQLRPATAASASSGATRAERSRAEGAA